MVQETVISTKGCLFHACTRDVTRCVRLPISLFISWATIHLLGLCLSVYPSPYLSVELQLISYGIMENASFK